MNSLVLRIRQSLINFWQQCAPREQLALQIMAIVLVFAALAQGAWSLEQRRQLLLRQLPRLAAAAEQSDRLYHDWQELTATNAARPLPRPEILRQAVEQRLGELGPGLSVRWNGPGELQLEGRGELARWLNWVAAMQRENRLLLQRARLQPAGEGVLIEAVFTFPMAAR